MRDTVDGIMTGTKGFLVNSWKEIYVYTKLVDASITRALSHTQWRVLGYGPYQSLSDLHKEEVINHLCERYLSLNDQVSRYELACHFKFHNWKLYNDLIVSGLLLERGGDFVGGDVWLISGNEDGDGNENMQVTDHLLLNGDGDGDGGIGMDGVSPLWFYLPNKNGEKPESGTPWLCFGRKDCKALEEGFKSQLQAIACAPEDCHKCSDVVLEEPENQIGDISDVDVDVDTGDCSTYVYPTIAQWYEPNLPQDVLVHEDREAVSFLNMYYSQDPSKHTNIGAPALRNHFHNDGSYVDSNIGARTGALRPPIQMLMRPIFWRYHGMGDEVRRGVWLLDTQRNGLQPYSEESAAILEDAYLTLKWIQRNGNPKDQHGNALESSLPVLTVQVVHGDETQLIQFRSLNQITATQKSVAGGLSLFKRRVYRGVDMVPETESEHSSDDNCTSSPQSHTDGVIGGDDTGSPKIIAAPIALAPSRFRESDIDTNQNADEVEHLVLVVHGIGEMLRTGDLLGLSLPAMTSSIVDCCASMRDNHMQVTGEVSICQNRRVEYLPIEWHEPFAIQSRGPVQEEVATLTDISLNTIPHLRNFANDTMLDSKFAKCTKHFILRLSILTDLNFISTFLHVPKASRYYVGYSV